MSFDNAGYAETMAKSSGVVAVFTPEMYRYLLSLVPTPEAYAELHNRMEANHPAVLKGDTEKAQEFEADRKALGSSINLIFGLVRAVALKDPSVSEKFGLGRANEKQGAAAPLTNPHGFKVVYDPQGRLFASVTRVPGARGYQVWACDSEPSLEANWRLVASSTSCRAIAITGLNRAKFNLLKIRAMRGNRPGPWSNFVNIEPT